MKRRITNLMVILALIVFFANTGICNDPDPNTPWPIGFNTSEMGISRTLMNSIGNMNGAWEDSWFHAGIDIDGTTGDPDCNEVRCMDDGYVTSRDEFVISGSDLTQWQVIICDELGGAVPRGWAYGHLSEPLFLEDEYVPAGALIGYMNENVDPVHLHFVWTDWNSYDFSYCNPLKYLNPDPSLSEGYTWEFNPDEHNPPFQYFFLPQIFYTAWGELSVEEANELIIDPSDLSGHVDFFFGIGLRGDGMPGGEGDGSNDLTPQKIKWDIVREFPGGDEVLNTSYVFDFDCILTNLPNVDARAKMLYFKYGFAFRYTVQALCLSNCTDADDWTGIETIDEGSWKTNVDCEDSEDTDNPVLASFPDGPYKINVFSYAYDITEVDIASIDVELHNFSPVVEKVVISCEGTTVWSAYWTADGLTPVLNNPVDAGVLPDQELDITVVFSEPMDTTSVTVTAGVTSPYSDITASDTGLDWSWTNCPEEAQYKDTWHGVFDDLTACTSGRMTISIQAQDHDANGLTDPSASIYEGRYNDTHHSFSVIGSQPGWPITLHDNMSGSPVLADLDGDGDFDVVVQCEDGYVHVLDDDGSTLNSNWPMHSGGWGSINVYSSPTVVDLDGGGLDILSVHAWGCHARDVSTGSNISGWPVNMGGSPAPGFYPSMSSPAIEDVDGDGYPEMVLCRHLSGSTILEPTVYLYEHTGGTFTWCRNLESSLGGSSVINTPAIGEVSTSHSGMEIIVCTAEGFQTGMKELDTKSLNSAVYLLDPSDGSNIWKTSFNTWFYASPVVADVDNDDVNEIIIGTTFGTDQWKVLVLNGNTGAVEHTWNVGNWVQGPVAIGDVNHDGYLDIAASVLGGTVECWSGEDYSSIPGFPVSVGSSPSRGPSIADIDGDFELEIVVGTADGYLYAINNDGSICSGFPVSCGNGVYGQVAIGNIDDDSSLEIVFADDDAAVLYCYDLGAGTFPALMPWRQFQHDSWHTGCFNADNTIPEPPTNLTGEIEYSLLGGEVDLEWDLSVNDLNSGSPQEPTDVIWYGIMRAFPPSVPFQLISKVHAGTSTYTDRYSGHVGPGVAYKVFASDGTNESEFSNRIKFPTSPSDVISLGCCVSEEFAVESVLTRILQASDMQPSEMQISEESSHAEITSVYERTAETLPTVTDHAVPSRGNPGCLTDGSTEVCYSPSHGADAVVIDLGDECTVTSILTERVSGISPDVSSFTDESVRTLEVTPHVEPSLLIEVAGSDREFYQFTAELQSSTENVRYIRVQGASGLSEISVYGSREMVDTVSSVEITRSTDTDGWMFAIPLVEYSEEAWVKIYDVSGRMIWSGHAESGSVLHWNGFTGNGTVVPNGVYLLQCSIGSQISTGSFVVRTD